MAGLVERYRARASELSAPGSPYTETDARSQFIDGFLETLGWDVKNEAGLPLRALEVVMERTGTDQGTSWGRPDYRLRVSGVDYVPVEAKKPAVRLRTDHGAALQARSYGWSLSLPAAVLTNFHETVIYDATIEPRDGDNADVAVIPGCQFGYEDYLTRFDELWRRLSYESLVDGGLEEVYGYTRPPRGDSPFDERFLSEFRRWRRLLAQDIATNNPALTANEIGRRTQRLLNALLFLRVCEDRDISRYEGLLESASASSVMESFRAADQTFNAGMFTVLDDTAVSARILLHVIREMYWPRTRFAFGVLRPDILAGLYEQYLAERVVLDARGNVTLETKPELSHAGGVVVTPDFVVHAINDATIDPLLSDGVPADFSVIDLACGSGVFLVDVFDRLLDAQELAGRPVDLQARGRLAQHHIFGVDIDGAAVEVTKLSLLLAILGDEGISVDEDSQRLPDLGRNLITGNSVVREDFDTIVPAAGRDVTRRAAVSPLNLSAAIGDRYPAHGFAAVIGNPPYVRIQTQAQFMSDQLQYLQDPRSRYESPGAHNFDLYQVFIERALELLSDSGRLGYITPHRFTNHQAGSAVRRKVGERLDRLVYFGEEQVFHNRTTYTALVIAGPATSESASIEIVSDLDAWKSGEPGAIADVARSDLGAADWPVVSSEKAELFAALERGAVAHLGDSGWVQVFVGIQTSIDKLYFVAGPRDVRPDQVVTVTNGFGERFDVEGGLLRPAILDQRIEVYDGQPAPDRYAIFPYKIEQRGTGSLKATVLTTEEMAAAFPRALGYFRSHRDQLVARSITPDPGEHFWAYGRSQSLVKLDEPKLIVRVMSIAPRYAQDDRGLVVPGGGDGGPYYLLRPQADCPYSIRVIQAILSHPAVDAFVASGRKYRGSYASHRKKFLVRAPLPQLSQQDLEVIDECVGELQELSVRLRSEADEAVLRSIHDRRNHLSRRVNAILNAAYGIDDDLVSRAVGE